MTPESSQHIAQDELIKQQRTTLFPKIRSYTEKVANHDGILSVALAELQPPQKQLLFGIIAYNATVVKFGRTTKEEQSYIYNGNGNWETRDPLVIGYVAELHKVGLEKIDPYMMIAEITSRSILDRFQKEFGTIPNQ